MFDDILFKNVFLNKNTLDDPNAVNKKVKIPPSNDCIIGFDS